jgi:hypothetical protein
VLAPDAALVPQTPFEGSAIEFDTSPGGVYDLRA